MLKRLVRHRIFQTLAILLLVLIAALAPIRHDYTYDQYPGNCSKDCGYGNETTEVRYGIPWTWASLSKTVSVYDKHIVSQQSSYQTKNLALDLGLYTVVIVSWLAGRRINLARRHAHIGD